VFTTSCITANELHISPLPLPGIEEHRFVLPTIRIGIALLWHLRDKPLTLSELRHRPDMGDALVLVAATAVETSPRLGASERGRCPSP
jgi:hypothetical protein